MHCIYLLPKKLTYSMCKVSLVVKYSSIWSTETRIVSLVVKYMIMAMQYKYSTQGVNNDYVQCVSRHLPLHTTYSYLPKLLLQIT